MYRPQTLDEIVGQTRAKTVCKIMISSAKKRNNALGHLLFAGPSGTGKTTFAQTIAKEMGVQFHTINASIVKTIFDMFGKSEKLIERCDVVFIDEVHRLPMRVFESLYTIMEDFHYNGQNIPRFTLVGATTLMGSLPKPFRDRFKHIQEFDEYTIEELSDIVHRVAETYSIKLSDSVAETVAKTCKKNPRTVVTRTEWLRDYMVANDLQTLSESCLRDTFYLQGIDENGLENRDRRYLEILKEGTTGLSMLASKLNIDEETIKYEIEPYLIKEGFIEITKAGRSLAYATKNTLEQFKELI